MQLKPLRDRLLVKRYKEEETTRNGIFIPDTAKEKPIEGEVVALGSGRTLKNGRAIPTELKEGDEILFGKYSGTEVKIEGDEYLILKEDDVLGIL